MLSALRGEIEIAAPGERGAVGGLPTRIALRGSNKQGKPRTWAVALDGTPEERARAARDASCGGAATPLRRGRRLWEVAITRLRAQPPPDGGAAAAEGVRSSRSPSAGRREQWRGVAIGVCSEEGLRRESVLSSALGSDQARASWALLSHGGEKVCGGRREPFVRRSLVVGDVVGVEVDVDEGDYCVHSLRRTRPNSLAPTRSPPIPIHRSNF